MKVVVIVVASILLILFNPSIEQHREAVGEFFDKRWNEDLNEKRDSLSWFDKAVLFVAGDSIKLSMKEMVLSGLYRENYALFSLGYIEGHVATIGVLGFVYVSIGN